MPQYGRPVAEAIDVAKGADSVGLDIWVGGQFLPFPGSDPSKSAFEALTMLGAIAATTSRSRIGVMALPAPLFHPFHLAKSLLTIDHLSSGRLDVGLGIGWHPGEFAALGRALGAVKQRASDLEACLDVLEAACAGVEFRQIGLAIDRSGPPALQVPHPPWWIAGSGATILQLAARRGDWVNFARGIGPADFAAAAQKLRSAEREADRSRSVQLSLTGAFIMGEPDEVDAILVARAKDRQLAPDIYRSQIVRSGVFIGTPADVSDQLNVYRRLGCEGFILWPLDGRWRAAIPGLAEIAAVH
jgi:alkanesulfonate monooxygenase SsuD/methylene tetrahydromethanopterin reductase-like flavin-dependent oxidoreductase (luciferase family)